MAFPTLSFADIATRNRSISILSKPLLPSIPVIATIPIIQPVAPITPIAPSISIAAPMPLTALGNITPFPWQTILISLVVAGVTVIVVVKYNKYQEKKRAEGLKRQL